MRPSIPSLAKLSPPRLPKVVARQRLFKELDRAKDYPITWITAPPGMGKTTLAASYLTARKLRCLWYQVDEGDADPATLFHYLGLASKKAAPRYRQPLPHLTPEYLPGLPIFSRRFFETFFGRMKAPAILVLDNYQQLPSDAPSQELLTMGFQEIPECVRVVVLSRTDPPPAFARLQADQKMFCLKEEALHLTKQEITSVVKLKRGNRDNEQLEVERLERLTEGWVGGVILSLEHGPRNPVQTNLGPQQTPEVVFEYLAREVMQDLPENEQDVLLKTAFASSVTESMAQSLSGNANAGKILSNLYRRRYFTERRFELEPVYQYHPLFRSFLQQKSQERFPPQRLTQLLTDTGQILAEHGHSEEALILLLQVCAYTEAIPLILQQAPSLFLQGRGNQLETWIQHIPDELLAQHPWLLFWGGQCHRTHDLKKAEQWFIRAFREFEDIQDVEGQLSTWCALVETIHLSWSDWRKLNPWINILSKHIATVPQFPNSELHAQVTFDMFVFLSLYDSQHSDLSHWKTLALNMLKSYPLLLSQLPSGFLVPLVFIVYGELTTASKILLQMKDNTLRGTILPLTRLSVWYTEAHVEWLKGNRKRAEQLIDQAIAHGQKTGCLVQELHFVFLRFWVAWLDYDFVAMQKILSLFSQKIQPQQSHFKDHIELATGALSLLKGDDNHAQHCLSNFTERHTIPFILTDGYSQGWSAQIAYAQGNIHLANSHQEKLVALGRTKNNLHFLIFGLGNQAVWALDRGDEHAARQCLAEGLPLVRAQDLQFFHYWPKSKFSVLCAKALEWDIEVEFVQTLVRKFGLIPEQKTMVILNWPWAVKVRTLGKFEIEIDGQALQPSRKTQRRPLMLVKALVALGGKEVLETQLSDALWPDADGDMAHQSFATTLYRLRKLLGHEQAILLKDGKVSFNPQLCWTDVWACEERAEHAKKGTKKPGNRQALQQCEQVLNVYNGSFLPDDLDEPWTHPMRERLRGQFIRKLCRSCEQLLELGDSDHAVSCLTQAIEREPLANPLYRALADALRTLNRKAEAQSVEEQFQKLSRHSLGVEVTIQPSASSRTSQDVHHA